MPIPKAIYVLDTGLFDQVYGPAEQRDLSQLVEILAPPLTSRELAARPDLLREVELIFSSWGAPEMDAAFLEAAPRLRAVFYAAGSVRGIVTDAFWERGIVMCNAAALNAVPVAEYTLGAILLSLRHVWRYARLMRAARGHPQREPIPGGYGRTVGLVSLGLIGRLVRERLRPFDLEVVAYDPFVTPEAARELGVTLLGLEDLFRRADVVSVHTPWLPETEGLITGVHVAAMKPGATLINTARGAVLQEPEVVAVLRGRPDLQAVLDVTHPEPPEPGSPLYELPNVVLTPHIAGSVNDECRRMGRGMVEECRRYLAGEPLQWRLTPERAARMA